MEPNAYNITAGEGNGVLCQDRFDFELNPNKTHFKGHPRLGPSLTGHSQPHQVRIDFFSEEFPKY